jgi:hypothetical protein
MCKGALVAINFADMQPRAAMSPDFVTWAPVTAEDGLDDPSWLDRDRQAE